MSTDQQLPSDFLSELQWRGLVAQSTDVDSLRAALDEGPLRLYCGFDPTAASLHVGNLVPLMTLRRFQQAGHLPIALVGGATGLIGDPSGRSSERSLQDESIVEEWVKRIASQLSVVLDFSGSSAATLVSNLDWVGQLSAIELLRDVGKHFSVNQMLAKESVQTRLAGEGISYTEFSYMVLQAYDYLELYRKHDCRLQIGGSDQWGNITAGLDLIRRVTGSEGPSAHALTVPLVVKADGQKFGKTAGGAIWLDSHLTSPYDFYQFWLNTDDRDIVKFLRYFSLRTPAEIVEIEHANAEHPERRIAQRALAAELTTLLHGQRATTQVEQASQALFGRGQLDDLDANTLEAALSEAPHGASDGDCLLLDALVECGLVASKGAARRAMKEGGIYVNNVRITDQEFTLDANGALAGGWIVLRRGKRNVAGWKIGSFA